jgi:hypothetical protein
MNQAGQLSAAERLAVLQMIDTHRAWHSLLDRRLCRRCTKSFRGWEVRLEQKADGGYDLRCPTEGCDSPPEHWPHYGTDNHADRSTPSPLPEAEVDFSNW